MSCTVTFKSKFYTKIFLSVETHLFVVFVCDNSSELLCWGVVLTLHYCHPMANLHLTNITLHIKRDIWSPDTDCCPPDLFSQEVNLAHFSWHQLTVTNVDFHFLIILENDH